MSYGAMESGFQAFRMRMSECRLKAHWSAREVAGKYLLAPASTFEVLVSHAKVLAVVLAPAVKVLGIHHHRVG
jgi:hypothetical protein